MTAVKVGWKKAMTLATVIGLGLTACGGSGTTSPTVAPVPSSTIASTVPTTTVASTTTTMIAATTTTLSEEQKLVKFEEDVAAAKAAEEVDPPEPQDFIGSMTLGSARVESAVVVADDRTVDDQRELYRGILLYSPMRRCTDRAVLLGHRTTGPAPFRHLDQTQVGDIVTADLGGLNCSWKVRSLDLVTDREADERWRQTANESIAILVACACADGSQGCVSHRWYVTADPV